MASERQVRESLDKAKNNLSRCARIYAGLYLAQGLMSAGIDEAERNLADAAIWYGNAVREAGHK